ncbi:cation-translocating P-type ATPase [Williamwhitmania taraxaci]|uniref:Ca2+-transporting ATPase n=1 Tax=Williamwhitmania taraxaci TaxID=1640674 RepID=A0A1G6ILE5_9BACT|nr:HAD-IC family P-type ATPase [Williamwhitmania taraxaci]SDC07382.1 Ca2+-transporting ATPase [Williamwhitmania taraxaci]
MNKETTSTNHWHSIEQQIVLNTLESSMDGLSPTEAANRITIFGKNKIHRKPKDGPLTLLWRQINNPLIWVLLGSSTIATALGKITDGLVVLAVVVVNSIIGFIQEFKAGKAIEALSDMVPQNATVIRDGKSITIPVADLVPGDIVLLAAGDRVPADMRLIAQKNLQVEEAALTGESVPAQKNIIPVKGNTVLGDRKCMVYSGTLVTSGTATAIVTATGMQTELGRISTMLSEATPMETPLTQKLATIGKYLTIGIVAITLVILVIGTIRALGQGILLGVALKDSLIFAIALAVGAIPEGLPAVVTIALAIGVQRMARRNAIIRKLPAVETLGSTTVICSDKTGTLTRNEMTVNEIWTHQQSFTISGVGYDPNGEFKLDGLAIDKLPASIKTLLIKATLCNDATLEQEDGSWVITGDPTEAALIVASAKAAIGHSDLKQKHPRVDELPFDSENQYMATLHGGERPLIAIKGAPEVILKRCSIAFGDTPIDTKRVAAEIEKMGAKGMRVLAIATKQWLPNQSMELKMEDVESNLTFVGLIGMIDPARIEAKESIRACHDAGIVVKMITGDHKTTARTIGMDLGLSENGEVITGIELAEMDDAQIDYAAAHTNIFARVAPEHKLRLVRALQRNGEIVAMTGDGVNDAPSLKQSNIGVAMGITGTSVSKESSDIILADDNFASISAAVEEGRRVYDNLIKSLAFLLPTNLGLAFILIYGIMFFPFDPVTKALLLPMLPTQLLWINLVAAVALALPLAFEVMEPNIMHRPPRKPDAPLFNGFVVFRVFAVSLLMTAGNIILFSTEYANAIAAGLPEVLAISKAQTVGVTFVIMFQIFYMINCRSLNDSVFKIGFFSNKTVFVGVGIVLGLQALFIYLPLMQKIFKTSPLDLHGLLISTAVGFAIFPLIGIEKWIRARKRS